MMYYARHKHSNLAVFILSTYKKTFKGKVIESNDAFKIGEVSNKFSKSDFHLCIEWDHLQTINETIKALTTLQKQTWTS